MNTKTDIDVVIRYLEDPDNEQHKNALNAWIQEDAGNLDIFLDMKAMWQGDALPVASPYDTHQAWLALEAALEETPPVTAPAATPAKIKPMLPRYWWAAAAAIAAGILWFWIGPSRYHTFQTAQLVDSLRLPDGSMVYLNANTSIRYSKNFQSAERKIYVDKGEAFFEVAPHAVQPFTVDTRSVEVQVLGTSFNVRENAGNVKVFVQTGKVSAAYKGTSRKVILTPGEEASLRRNSSNIDTRLYKKNNNVLAWKTKWLNFDDAPLPDVAAALESCYNVPVVIKNDALADKKLLATFRNMPLEEVLDIMRKTLQVNISYKDNLIEIY